MRSKYSEKTGWTRRIFFKKKNPSELPSSRIRQSHHHHHLFLSPLLFLWCIGSEAKNLYSSICGTIPSRLVRLLKLARFSASFPGVLQKSVSLSMKSKWKEVWLFVPLCTCASGKDPFLSLFTTFFEKRLSWHTVVWNTTKNVSTI